ncbi:DUF397 domain-containing protein [Nocardiopsis sp. CT-R113]|uniref:DUF397 domain-containing protein n=1 Tax=Nocardiopsis codii TaxID=3065942 RepID=A0ABU7K4L9_9ACTN|nr:DUF397 domain-containing protein [Nocardiopsis sp. CT-R113]MEE2037188.1 DUF397 domain-containing protein [Nocardiopsis sp. CT-R113]
MRRREQDQRTWHTSSYSQGVTNCVEVSEGTTTAVRDSRNRGRGHLEFPHGEWTALLVTVA